MNTKVTKLLLTSASALFLLSQPAGAMLPDTDVEKTTSSVPAIAPVSRPAAHSYTTDSSSDVPAASAVIKRLIISMPDDSAVTGLHLNVGGVHYDVDPHSAPLKQVKIGILSVLGREFSVLLDSPIVRGVPMLCPLSISQSGGVDEMKGTHGSLMSAEGAVLRPSTTFPGPYELERAPFGISAHDSAMVAAVTRKTSNVVYPPLKALLGQNIPFQKKRNTREEVPCFEFKDIQGLIATGEASAVYSRDVVCTRAASIDPHHLEEAYANGSLYLQLSRSGEALSETVYENNIPFSSPQYVITHQPETLSSQVFEGRRVSSFAPPTTSRFIWLLSSRSAPCQAVVASQEAPSASPAVASPATAG